jgi:translation elongation factor EF-Tu-like GTPase
MTGGLSLSRRHPRRNETMSTADFAASPTQGNIWIIGHAGHGKSTLTAAIARLTPGRRCVAIDGASPCPQNTEAAILVVSAADGPMPQTRDHLKLARQAGVPRLVIYLNKIDVADKDLVELVEMELRQLSTMCGFEGEKVAIVRGSAKKALEGDASAIGEPSIERLLNAVGGGGSSVEPVVTSSGGLLDFFRNLF